eukprot:TRINITY_DN10917_c0_g1_i2.p1 TRINITY_DN10917_c0_g1~~TRINITY_DN10917_c0_g1_i2.p1  ORF type:complete len:162 (+),score=27.24 TRINITY_DN10917_c0_g1_i2:86-571(+)
MKYYKALGCCFKKNKRNIGYIYSIIKCGYKRKIDGLDLLLIDMKIRKLINLPPPESYRLDQSKGCCSIDTFMSFITRNGNSNTNILQCLKEFYDLMNKYIKSSGLVKKELFALLEQYMMKAELKLSLIHISEPTRPLYISYAVFCLKKKKKNKNPTQTPRR